MDFVADRLATGPGEEARQQPEQRSADSGEFPFRRFDIEDLCV